MEEGETYLSVLLAGFSSGSLLLQSLLLWERIEWVKSNVSLTRLWHHIERFNPCLSGQVVLWWNGCNSFDCQRFHERICFNFFVLCSFSFYDELHSLGNWPWVIGERGSEKMEREQSDRGVVRQVAIRVSRGSHVFQVGNQTLNKLTCKTQFKIKQTSAIIRPNLHFQGEQLITVNNLTLEWNPPLEGEIRIVCENRSLIRCVGRLL